MADFFVDGAPASQNAVGSYTIWFSPKSCGGKPGQNTTTGYLGQSQVASSSSTNIQAYRDTCLAYFDPTSSTPSTPTNQAALDGLTDQFQLDTSNWNRLTFLYGFTGILNFAQSGLVDSYEFQYTNNHGICSTRIYTYPFDYQVHELGHYDYPEDCLTIDDGVPNFDASPYQAYYGPPGISQYNLSLEDGRLLSKYIQAVALGGIEAIVTTQIPACVGNNYGIGGYVQIMTKSGSTAIPDPDYPNPVPVDNWYLATVIPVTTHCTVSLRATGWLLLGANC
jgi:hypothetical protein